MIEIFWTGLILMQYEENMKKILIMEVIIHSCVLSHSFQLPNKFAQSNCEQSYDNPDYLKISKIFGET